MAVYTVIPAKRPTGRISPVAPEPVPTPEKPTRPQSPTPSAPDMKANGHNEGAGPVSR
jgi:hypothetical protein